jgi:hypothetical protein
LCSTRRGLSSSSNSCSSRLRASTNKRVV